ncbi:hypothetical protein [Chenggangzhangella methanolivorans]|uniref:Uncharacterized protein n=1 Tax=Chenggangzhangella methanolivorans TaxID=1437009 RepID=A0A9E6UM43_9HYPH|nr:hypothetical protein [Chenggangzhangella methanolivorans]QZN99670.1 hypothetical protein K6K41_23760 [Chenggangzhangella methanolivorans]
MSPSVKRALKLTGALAAGSAVLWFAMELWVTRSATILVVSKQTHGSPDLVLRGVVDADGMAFGVGIDTIANEDRDALWEKLRPGCRYRVRFVDQGRYPSGRRRKMSGSVIAAATPLNCPGLPNEPDRPALSGAELLERLTSPQTSPER